MIRPARACAAAIALALGCHAAAAAPARIAWAVAVLPSGAEFNLEIAADAEARRRGYMYREHVGPDEGMLFVFPAEAQQSFWMKNCKVPLDIVFLDASLRVVEIAHEQQPCPAEGPCPNIVPLRPARYVLELGGGQAKRHGLAPGDRVTILSEPPLQ